MIENDNLQRFMFENAPVRGEYIHLSTSFQAILAQHNYPPAVQQLLGEALCAVVLLTALIKFKGRLSIQFKGSGKLKMLLAQCDHHFHVRAIAKWDEGEATYDDLVGSFKEGILSIMLSPAANTQSYQGVVAWSGNSLAESLEGYFKTSEQLATRLWFSVNPSSAAGLLLQAMPGEDRNQPMEQEAIEEQWQRIAGPLNNMQKIELLGVGIESLLHQLYPEEDVRIFEPHPVHFRCTCSRERGEQAILILGKEEAEEELVAKKEIVVTCDFCNKDYVYDKVDVASIFANKGPSHHADLH